LRTDAALKTTVLQSNLHDHALLPANEASGSISPTVPADQQSKMLQESRKGAPRLHLFLDSPRQDAGDLAIQSPIAAGPCAHMIIAVAPRVDSQMITVAPGRSPHNMPALQGLPPCPEDIRGLAVPLVDPNNPRP
jgi:hypothetical protein